jgi:hypothetical protein
MGGDWSGVVDPVAVHGAATRVPTRDEPGLAAAYRL